jgi:CRISPR-associated protein Cmr5
MITLEQQRAEDAWQRSAKYGKEHVKLVKGLPALIMNSGLMQVMAFLEEKGAKQRHCADVAKDMREWIHTRFGTLPQDFPGFMTAILKSDSHQYQAVTTETFAWLKWLRQIAAARKGA